MKTKLTNLADGTVGANSTDAVTGGQLHTVETKITQLSNTVTNDKFDKSRAKFKLAGDSTQTTDVSDINLDVATPPTVQIKSGNASHLTSTQANGVITLTPVVADATSAATFETDAKKGTTSGLATSAGVKAYVDSVKSSLSTTGLNFAGDDTTVGKVITAQLGKQVQIAGGTQNIAKAGATQEDNKKLVNVSAASDTNGGVKYEITLDTNNVAKAIGNAIQGTAGADGKNALLDGLTVGYKKEGETAKATTLATGFTFAQGTGTVGKSTVGNEVATDKLATKAGIAIDVADNGKITIGLDEATRTKLDSVASTSDLSSYAKIDASNVTTANAAAWATKLGTGTVGSGVNSGTNVSATHATDTNLVTGKTVYEAIQTAKTAVETTVTNKGFKVAGNTGGAQAVKLGDTLKVEGDNTLVKVASSNDTTNGTKLAITLDTKALTKEIIGKEGVNGRDGTDGPAGVDALNGKSLKDKVQGLRDGLSGTMVYTNEAGDRLTNINGKYYTAAEAKKIQDKVAANEYKLAEDGNYYAADQFTPEGALIEHATKADFTTVAKALGNDEVFISGVRQDGSTTQPVALRNVSSVAGNGTTATFTDKGLTVATTGAGAKTITIGKDGIGMDSTKITSLAQGTADTDAVNVAQLKGAATALGGGAKIADADDTAKNIKKGDFVAPTYNLTVKNAGTIDAKPTAGDRATTPYSDVGTALSALDKAVVTNFDKVTSLETKVGDGSFVVAGDVETDGAKEASQKLTKKLTLSGAAQKVGSQQKAGAAVGTMEDVTAQLVTTKVTPVKNGADATGDVNVELSINTNELAKALGETLKGADGTAGKDGKTPLLEGLTVSYKKEGDTQAKETTLLKGFTFAEGRGTTPKAGAGTPPATDAETTKEGIAITVGTDGKVTIGLDAAVRSKLDSVASTADLTSYAKTDASNLLNTAKIGSGLDADAQTNWAKALGTGTVGSGVSTGTNASPTHATDNNLVTGKTVYAAIEAAKTAVETAITDTGFTVVGDTATAGKNSATQKLGQNLTITGSAQKVGAQATDTAQLITSKVTPDGTTGATKVELTVDTTNLAKAILNGVNGADGKNGKDALLDGLTVGYNVNSAAAAKTTSLKQALTSLVVRVLRLSRMQLRMRRLQIPLRRKKVSKS